jgi:hypothetical protein
MDYAVIRNDEMKAAAEADREASRIVDEHCKDMTAMNHRTLINWGRKAGLRTSELYTALATRRPEAGDQAGGQADGNGFVSGYGEKGQRVYRPLGSYPRP